MNRFDIISTVGNSYYSTNLENGEYSYLKALNIVKKDIKDYQSLDDERNYRHLDIRFENERLAVLIETKDRFSNYDKKAIQLQLQAYVRYEKAYSDRKIVAILAETDGDEVWTWFGESVIIDDRHKKNIKSILSFTEYEELCFGRVNDKLKVVDSIKTLNEMLHSDGISEKLRSQFVGTCLLALKNGLVYEGVKPKTVIDENKKPQILPPEKVILQDIRDILKALLVDDVGDAGLDKAGKLSILNDRILKDQAVLSLSYDDLKVLLTYIDKNIVPYINDKNTAGQDLLSLFFTTFNKYVGKADKNQAFTPDHICNFMSKVLNINQKSRVLDPCCGSGSFLVRAMTDAMDDCETESERNYVKEHQIYGIEYEEGAFGLSSTNMLIHGDGNSNIVKDSMFNKSQWIRDANINAVLMNPPYNATKNHCDPSYVKKWASNTSQDPSKGLHFVEWVANHVSANAKIAVLLPMQAAIGNSSETKHFKKKLLEKYTLDAVFSLPDEIFYPGASAVACCMVFDLSQKHEKADRSTFFGYFKNDNFIKRKGLGRVDKIDENGNSLWEQTEKKWLDLYRNKIEVAGLSVMQKVTYEDEWLAEAYMETDYSTLSDDDFQRTINNYLSFLVKEGLSTND